MSSNESPNLDICDSEPIHLLGGLQPFAYAIAISSDWFVQFATVNIEQIIGKPATSIVGSALSDHLDGDLLHQLRNAAAALSSPGSFRSILSLTIGERAMDLSIHRTDTGYLIEIEPSQEDSLFPTEAAVLPIVNRLKQANNPRDLFAKAASLVKSLTGFDRVMGYQFLADGSGEVIAEKAAGHLPAFKGLRYPASDIPKQARALYVKKCIRIISDVDAAPVPFVPEYGSDGRPIDLTYSTFRSVSPVHLEYLRNMGVKASMSISIIVDGKLWGLIACHHMSPHILSLKARAAPELISELLGLFVSNLQNEAGRKSLLERRLILNELESQLSAIPDVASALSRHSDQLMQAFQASAMLVVWDGREDSYGNAPSSAAIRSLVEFLNTTQPNTNFSTHELRRVLPWAERLGNHHCGLLAISLSRQPRDYLIFLRDEIITSTTWAGNPDKSVLQQPDTARLSPRKSFEAYRQTVRDQSSPWSTSDLAFASDMRQLLIQSTLVRVEGIEKERAKNQERQELLIAELNHRVRNILALVRSLINQSADPNLTGSEVVDMLGRRVASLARAHDQITREHWGPGSLLSIIRGEVAAFVANEARLKATGPDVMLKPEALSDLALVFHEITTNAAKYGSLVDESGHVDLHLELLDSGDLCVRWREVGGPAVKPPSREGFGSTIINKIIPHSLGGQCRTEFHPGGVEIAIRIPARHVSSERAPAPTPADTRSTGRPVEANAQSGPLSGRVLLLEDNLIIALTGEQYLLSLGAEEVSVVGNASKAIEEIDRSRFSAALLDVNLGDHNCAPVAQTLSDAGVPFAFCTGYGDVDSLLQTFSDHPVVSKPYELDDLRAAFKVALEDQR